MNGADNFFDTQLGSNGIAAGPKLTASLFIPNGIGLVWIDANGLYWQQTLITNGDGTVDLQLVQVTF